jgi:4'-phosphopantetheinyl transferase
VWRASLDVQNAELRRLHSLLSVDELDRAARFRFVRDRNRFVIGRGLLRTILADYAEMAAEELRFGYSPYGKPRLLDRSEILFNVSHSADRVLVAVTPDIPVGVDVEVLDTKLADELVAERFFSEQEVRDLRSLPPAGRPRAFLTCWTRKEAFIKARGEGLSLPLQDFDVTLTPGVPPTLLRTAWSATEPVEWLLFDLSEDCPGCVAALAVRVARVAVSVREYGSGTAGSEPRMFALCAPSA